MGKATIEYLGFHNTADRRWYHLRSHLGPETQDYTVAIALAAFASGAARYQDGPDISFQKLQRELDTPDTSAQHQFVMTTAELASYRELHPVLARR